MDRRTFNKLAGLATMGALTVDLELNAQQAAAMAGEIVLEDSEDFPLVAIGIADPRFVLQREATFRFHFFAREQSLFLPRLQHGQHVGSRVHLNSKVRQCATLSGRVLIQCEIDGRIGHVKLGVTSSHFAGLNAEKFAVELDAGVDILDMDGHVSLARDNGLK